MSKFTFTSHVTAHAKAAVKTDGLMAKACDAMIADGITVAMFSKKTDDSDRGEDFRNGLKAAIIVSFSKANQQLLDTPTKGLSDAKKTHKRYMQQQIGARVNDYKRGLERRLEGPVVGSLLIRALLRRTVHAPFQTALVIVYMSANLLLHVALLRFLVIR